MVRQRVSGVSVCALFLAFSAISGWSQDRLTFEAASGQPAGAARFAVHAAGYDAIVQPDGLALSASTGSAPLRLRLLGASHHPKSPPSIPRQSSIATSIPALT